MPFNPQLPQLINPPQLPYEAIQQGAQSKILPILGGLHGLASVAEGYGQKKAIDKKREMAKNLALKIQSLYGKNKDAQAVAGLIANTDDPKIQLEALHYLLSSEEKERHLEETRNYRDSLLDLRERMLTVSEGKQSEPEERLADSYMMSNFNGEKSFENADSASKELDHIINKTGGRLTGNIELKGLFGLRKYYLNLKRQEKDSPPSQDSSHNLKDHFGGRLTR